MAILLFLLEKSKRREDRLQSALDTSTSSLVTQGVKLLNTEQALASTRAALKEAREYEVSSSTPSQLLAIATRLSASPPSLGAGDVLSPIPSPSFNPYPSSNELP